ncbi:MAG: hypothetical protein FWG55_06480 [Candidatus Bathyarchaeota archaeon]|nr:hypothetical protein [Candidatus Termiticorpusculum sp.]
MYKFLPLMLLGLFILSSFVVVFSVASASELVEDSWNTKAPMTQVRTGLGVVAVEGKIYAIGGYTDEVYTGMNNGYTGINERYDPKTDTWTTMMSMPTPRRNFAIAAYQGKIYCIGGEAAYDETGSPMLCGVTEVYDIATNSWSTKASIPISMVGSQGYFVGSVKGHVADGKIFVIAYSSLYMYDPVADIWTNKPNPPLFFAECVSAVADDKIIYAGNIITQSGGGEFPTVAGWEGSMKIMIYDPATNEWTGEKAETTITSGNGDAGTTTGVYAPKRVYILGLQNNNKVYDFTTDTWTRGTPMPSSRQNFGIAVVDDILYVIGGSSISGTLSDLNEQYVPIGYNSVSVNPEMSDSSVPSEPYRDYTRLIMIVSAVIVTAVGLISSGLFFYLRKKS